VSMLAMKSDKVKGVTMFRSTCHKEQEEMSRDGSRWLRFDCKKWCGDGALSRRPRDRERERERERELGVIGPPCYRNLKRFF
jgi:hypothetical protein